MKKIITIPEEKAREAYRKGNIEIKKSLSLLFPTINFSKVIKPKYEVGEQFEFLQVLAVKEIILLPISGKYEYDMEEITFNAGIHSEEDLDGDIIRI